MVPLQLGRRMGSLRESRSGRDVSMFFETVFGHRIIRDELIRDGDLDRIRSGRNLTEVLGDNGSAEAGVEAISDFHREKHQSQRHR